MLERLIEQGRAIVQVLSTDPKTVHLKPRWQDTEVMECVVAALSPVSDLTDVLSGEDKVTASCLRPLISHLYEELACKEGEADLKVDIQEKILRYMKEKYSDTTVEKIINMSACLDPRFMLSYGSEDEITVVRQTMVEEGKVIARRLEEEMPPEPTQPSQQQEPQPQPPTKKRKLVDILTKVSTSRHEVLSNEERIQDELTRYLQCPHPQMKSNPLHWWKHQEKNFPILSRLAKK